MGINQTIAGSRKYLSSMISMIPVCLVFASNFHQITSQYAKCECMNPWDGLKMYQHIGDPDNTCPVGYCYVSCDCACKDCKKETGTTRCTSKVACDKRMSCDKKCSRG